MFCWSWICKNRCKFEGTERDPSTVVPAYSWERSGGLKRPEGKVQANTTEELEIVPSPFSFISACYF